jgi:ABC-2 type transport system ATP-binding protein
MNDPGKAACSCMIEVTGISKSYGSKTGVKALTFSVGSGEILGLLGPNGAGKSTTLRMLTGYLTPSSGSIRIDGIDLWENPVAVRARLGYLPDRPPLYREMTVQAYVDFAAALRGVSAAVRRQRVGEVLEATGLREVAGRLLGNLSRGFQQRAGLAQAIVHDPAVLVLDEPTTGLDPIQVSEIRALIQQLGRERTVILSSHILPEVQLLCQRVLVMDRGRVLAEDRPDRLSQRFQDSRRYRVQVFGDLEQAAVIARGVPGVTRAEVAGALLEIDSASDMDIRPDLFYRLAGARLPLLELTPVALSLEDVFLRLITDEHTAGGGVA